MANGTGPGPSPFQTRWKVLLSSVWLALILVAAPAHADEWWGPDKALHFTASAALAGGGYGVAAAAGGGDVTRIGVGTGVALGAGVAKELWDLAGHGDPSGKDLAWDVIGTAVGLALSLLVDKVVFGEPRAEPGVQPLR